MKPIVKDWIEKAEGDFATAQREMRARKNPNHDAACFHAQQCVEKYMKALLQQANVAFGKTHDLISLLDLLLETKPLWEEYRPLLRALNAFAVHFRYPGESADKAMATQAFKYCRMIRLRMREYLNIKS